MPVPSPRRRPDTRQAVPAFGREVVLIQLVKSLVAVPSPENEHAVRVHHARVTKPRPRRRLSSIPPDSSPPVRRIEREVLQIVEAGAPVETTENVHVSTVQSQRVVCPFRWRLTHVAYPLPRAASEVELVDVVEVLPVFFGVTAENPHDAFEHDLLRTGPLGWSYALGLDLPPDFALDVEGVHVGLPGGAVGAAEDLK